MSYRTINAFSLDQRNFNSVGTGNGSWSVEESTNNATIVTARSSIPMYPTYIPSENAPYSLDALIVAVTDSGTPPDNAPSVTVYSPLVPTSGGSTYTISIGTMPLRGNLNYIIEPEFFESSLSTEVLSVSKDPFSVNVINGSTFTLFDYFKSPANSRYCRLKITFSGYRSDINVAEDLPSSVGAVFFDPVICDVSSEKTSFFSNSVYSSLPSFMLVDDQNINDILGSGLNNDFQSPQPLRRYVEVLCNAADKMYLELEEFRYDRPVDGDEHKSKLVDPDTADPSYLRWLADVTGTRLIALTSGVSPWLALESEDTVEVGISGQWVDLYNLTPTAASAVEWLDLENANPNFFDVTQSYRDQIRTGVTGLNGGRPDKIVEYIRTMLSSTTKDTDVVVLHNEHMDNPFRANVIVDSTVDPDPSGNLIENFINNTASVGCYITKDSKVHHSGRGVYQLDDALYPNTYDNINACGSVIYGQPFISDYNHTGQHIVLNSGLGSSATPDIGGGIGAAHYSNSNAFYYGWYDVGGVPTPSSLVTQTPSNVVHQNGGDFDVVVVLSDIVEPRASLYTGSNLSTPPEYLFREKHLIVCGGTGGSGEEYYGNDWALYMASGLTPAPDNDVRLLFVSGYDTPTANNYVYSDPIDPSIFSQHKDVCIRLSVSGLTCKFYIQNSLYDDWESNVIGEVTLVSSQSSAARPTSADAVLQVLGNLDNGLWSDAEPLACAVKRVMMFNSGNRLSFVGEDSVNSAAHAISNGGNIDDFGSYSYRPTLDIDISNIDLYATSFDADTYQNGTGGTLGVVVNNAVSASASNNIDILAMRPHQQYGPLWHFGIADSTSTDDRLSVTVANAPTNMYWKMYTINTSDGSIDSTTYGGSVGGSPTINIDAYASYGGSFAGGSSVLAIEVRSDNTNWGGGVSPGDSSGLLAYFTPTLLATTDSAADDYSGTWTITRAWPSDESVYSPSQVIDLPCIHMYEGAPELAAATNSVHGFSLEHWSPFSMFFHVKRVWTGVEGVDTYEIFNVDYGGGARFRIYYDGPKIKATFSDGTNTESVEYIEAPAFGEWHIVVVRRNESTFGMVVDADVVNEDVTPVNLTDALPGVQPLRYFSQGFSDRWTPRFALARFTFFDRYLSDAEIALLETEVY